jgi:hypothetical protein
VFPGIIAGGRAVQSLLKELSELAQIITIGLEGVPRKAFYDHQMLQKSINGLLH